MNRSALIVCASVLLAALLGLAVVDNARPWRRLQAESLELERRDLDSRLAAIQAQQSELLSQHRAAIETEKARLAERRDEIAELERDLRAFRGKARLAELRLSRFRAELESAPLSPARSDEAPSDEAPGEQPGLVEVRQELRLARMEVEGLHELITDREHKLAAVREDLNTARARWSEATAPIEALEQQRRELGRDPLPALRGLWSPGVTVRQVAVVDYPTTDGTQRLDRCVTCHLAAIHEGFEDPDRPPHARAHPRLELFVGADSPHPYARFGCTVCHGGSGRATDFSRAGHTPRTNEQAAAWGATREWRQENLPRRPMIPLDLTDAACAQCHPSAAVTDTLEQGRFLISAMGCNGCHRSQHPALAGQAKAGPSLAGIAGKTRPAWAYQWLAAARKTRPKAWMPHVFKSETPGSETPGSEAERERRSTEIQAVVHYLWERSRPTIHEPPTQGDVEAGRALFTSVGCAACHLVDPMATGAALENRHGPNLSRVGSKVSAGWLNAWLRDPHSYRPDSPMPNLRLDASEAADLVAYLMTRRDPEWEDSDLPLLSAEVRDSLVLSHLEQNLGIEASQARLEAMGDSERTILLGERTIVQRGCHACHEIPGFETAPTPDSPSLKNIAERMRQRADADGEPAKRQRWLPSEHVPEYSLTGAETTAVTVAVLGLGANSEPDWAPNEQEAVLAAGRRIALRYNCRGCHLIEGRGRMTAAAHDSSQAAPDLTHVGARLKAPWLFSYLAHPAEVTTRPWLAIRMPSFALNETELNALVRYFAALDGGEILSFGPSRESSVEISQAVGRVVFDMLQCDSCHGDSENTDGPELAPSYRLARQRLRADWVVDWILDPEKWRPETLMPANFRTDTGSELDSSFLIGSISTPIFSPERERLRRLLGSDDELHGYLTDPEKVATALRDYLWTLGE